MSRRRIKVPAPNMLDRAIGYLAPGLAEGRMRSRAAMAVMGAYVGAQKGRASMRNWSTYSASPDADLLDDLDGLRSRSRDLVRNDPLAQSAISTKVVNVIGTGHVCRPEIDAKALGLTETQAQDWEEAALNIWTEWSTSPDCDVTRVQCFAELEDLVHRSQLLAGDVLAVRRFKERPGRLLGLSWQIVEGDRLSNPRWTTDSARLAGGVEMDGDGAAVAYHIADRYALDRRPGLQTSWQRVPARDGGDRPLVLHIHHTRWRPDMTRYAPMLAPVIESLKQRSRYSEAELMAAVISACFAIGMKSEDGNLAEGLQSGSDGGNEPSDIRITEPGQIFDLLPDEEIQSFEPGRPSAQFAPFIEAIAQEVGAGVDLPHELLVKQFQASYSASRAALEMAWQFFRTDRARHVSQFCAPVYEAVITEAVARGLLVAPGFFADPLRRRAWLGAVWMGPARPTVDPVKDATADEKWLEMGVTSLTRIAAERFGQDYRAIRRRRAQDGSDEVAARKAPPTGTPTPPAEEPDTDEGSDSDEETAHARR